MHWYSFFYGVCTILVINLIFSPYVKNRFLSDLDKVEKRMLELEGKVSEIELPPQVFAAFELYKHEGESFSDFILRMIKEHFQGGK